MPTGCKVIRNRLVSSTSRRCVLLRTHVYTDTWHEMCMGIMKYAKVMCQNSLDTFVFCVDLIN